MSNICFTLLKCLFHEQPPFLGDILVEHLNSVFPGREDFERFLEESDGQKRTKLAKRLISRLARESGVFIPFELLISMLRTEERHAPNIATSQYIPQDHFSHLVHLYLLGIYIFTHHKKFHRSIASYFKRKRERHTRVCSLSSDETVFFDFLFCWRSFVLLHDIGYPCELPPSSDDGLRSEIKKKYANIDELVCEEAALAFLSRIITFEQLGKNSSNVRCDVIAPRIFQRNEPDLLPGMGHHLNEIEEKWKSAIRIPFIHGKRFSSLSSHLNHPQDVLALLVHSRTGEPTVALVPSPSGKHKLVVLHEKATKHHLADLYRHAFELGTTPRATSRHPEYEWQMFCLNSTGNNNVFLRSVSEIINRNFSEELLRKVAWILSDEAPDPLVTITSDADYRSYELWVHETLQNWWQGIKQTPATDDASEYSIVSLCASSIEKDVALLISQFLREKIDMAISGASRADRGNLLEGGIEKIVKKATVSVFNNPGISEELIEYVQEKLHSSIESELDRNRLFEDTKLLTGKIYGRDDGVMVAEEPFSFIMNGAVDSSSHMLELNKLLKESSLPDYKVLYQSYHPEHLHESSVDHGLAGAACSLQIALLGEKLLERCAFRHGADDVKILSSFASIAVCLGDEIDASDLDYRIRMLMPEVTRAIALHNLYPKYLGAIEKKDFRVNLHREPFCFFAMLCDALQSWDRDQRLWQSDEKLKYKTNGYHYDISIVGDVIHIHEHDYGLDVAKHATALKSGLESYLKGVKDYIWLDLGERPIAR